MKTRDPEKEVHRLTIWYGDSILSVSQALSLPIVTLQYLVSILVVISLFQRADECGDIEFQAAGGRGKGESITYL